MAIIIGGGFCRGPAKGKVHSTTMTPRGRHPGKTEAVIPKAPNERADLVGQSYRERHRGQRAIGLQLRPDIWAHRSCMGSD